MTQNEIAILLSGMSMGFILCHFMYTILLSIFIKRKE